MKERGILMNAPMVRATLAGRKTQTRRVIKVKPWVEIEERDDGTKWPWFHDGENGVDVWIPCPYGQPGDLLWVREKWAAHWMYNDVAARDARSGLPDDNLWYAADPESTAGTHGCPAQGRRGKWRSSIHMPREASRLLLEVTEVRVQRLNDISEEDAVAEGLALPALITPGHVIGCFAQLWESINGPDSWAANPWVWCVSFRRIEA